MAEPDWSPDTGGRSLAEILREAGIESAARSARRRRSADIEDTGIRQRGSGPAAPGSDGGAPFGRRRSDQAPDPRTAAIPGLRPDRKPGVPGPSAPSAAPVASGGTVEANGAPVRERRASERTTGRVSDRPVARVAERAPDRGAQPAHERAADQRAPDERARRRSPRPTGTAAAGATSQPVQGRDGDFSTGPIPVVRAGDVQDADLESTPRESVLAWLRFAGELVIALAAGVGVYFAATVLWEMVPHVAVLLAPLAVTGLVAGVSVWRQRQGREPVGPRLLAVLVFAGTLLTIAPAAGLLAGS